MSNSTGSNGVTAPQTPTGLQVIQESDFYQKAGILHPITVGAIAICALFLYLRYSSNRCVAPVTLFDWILNVALGSTLAGIVNGTSLTRGILSLITLLSFQLVSSMMSTRLGERFEHAFNSPPLVIAFRGRALNKVMRQHRISKTDLNGAMRREGIWNIREVEAVIIEPTGTFSIYKRCDRPKDCDPEVLLDVPGYKSLVDHFDKDGSENDLHSLNPGMKKNGKGASDEEISKGREEANEIAADEA